MKSDYQILEKELSYKIYGIFLKVGKDLGNYCKEAVYQKACEEELKDSNIHYVGKPDIELYNYNNRLVGKLIPDLIVDDKIIIEIKAVKFLMESSINQLLKYLEKSRYEIGYLVNFGTSYIQIIRRIYTNDRKSHLRHEPARTIR